MCAAILPAATHSSRIDGYIPAMACGAVGIQGGREGGGERKRGRGRGRGKRRRSRKERWLGPWHEGPRARELEEEDYCGITPDLISVAAAK